MGKTELSGPSIGTSETFKRNNLYLNYVFNYVY